MKSVVNVKDIYGDISDKNRHIYLGDNGLHIRDIEIEANLPEPVEIGHVSDLHFNYCNQQDLDEAHPALMSNLENRKWLANAESVPTARRCLEFIKQSVGTAFEFSRNWSLLHHSVSRQFRWLLRICDYL